MGSSGGTGGESDAELTELKEMPSLPSQSPVHAPVVPVHILFDCSTDDTYAMFRRNRKVKRS